MIVHHASPAPAQAQNAARRRAEDPALAMLAVVAARRPSADHLRIAAPPAARAARAQPLADARRRLRRRRLRRRRQGAPAPRAFPWPRGLLRQPLRAPSRPMPSRGGASRSRTGAAAPASRTSGRGRTTRGQRRSRLADRKIQPDCAVGMSLGGNALLKWLGERGEAAKARVRRAAAVSAPIDLPAAGAALDRGLNRLIYTRYFLATLKPKSLAKLERFPGLYDAARCAARRFRDFDNAVTAPLHGFRDADHYWSEAASGRGSSTSACRRSPQRAQRPVPPGACARRGRAKAAPAWC